MQQGLYHKNTNNETTMSLPNQMYDMMRYFTKFLLFQQSLMIVIFFLPFSQFSLHPRHLILNPKA